MGFMKISGEKYVGRLIRIRQNWGLLESGRSGAY